ncbi:MAG: DUF423 domain-containing protein [Saprospiraceae bacterium]
MSEKFTRLAAILGAAAVIIGAFGAHSLKNRFEQQHLDPIGPLHTYETGVQYQFYHTLAIALVGLLLARMPDNKWLVRAGWFFLVGIICFSGSLYLLAMQPVVSFSMRWVGPVTPIGGLFFIAGWVSLLFSLGRKVG